MKCGAPKILNDTIPGRFRIIFALRDSDKVAESLINVYGMDRNEAEALAWVRANMLFYIRADLSLYFNKRLTDGEIESRLRDSLWNEYRESDEFVLNA